MDAAVEERINIYVAISNPDELKTSLVSTISGGIPARTAFRLGEDERIHRYLSRPDTSTVCASLVCSIQQTSRLTHMFLRTLVKDVKDLIRRHTDAKMQVPLIADSSTDGF